MPETGNKPYHPLSLSIRIHADGFSFFVCDPQTSRLVRGEHFRCSDSVPLAQQLSQELCRPDYFNRQIDQAYVLICSPSTHVPLEEFHRDEAEKFFSFTISDDDMSRQRVAYTIQPQLESVELYAIPRDIEEVILQFYPTARFFASRAMLMERLLHYNEDMGSDCRRLYFCPEGKGFSLFAFSGNHLQFANLFEADQVVNTLYYTLNVWQSLGMDALADRLVICSGGDNAELRQALAEYILNIDVVSDETLFPRVPLAHEKQVPTDLKALLLNRL